MKTRHLILFEINFFILIAAVNETFVAQREWRLLSFAALILAFSHVIYNYIGQSKNALRSYSISVFITFTSFESFKVLSFLMGMLPRYQDVPYWLSATLSFVSIALYVGVISTAVRVVKGQR